MDISMDIHGKSVDMDMAMDGKFHIHGKPGEMPAQLRCTNCAKRRKNYRGSVHCISLISVASCEPVLQLRSVTCHTGLHLLRDTEKRARPECQAEVKAV